MRLNKHTGKLNNNKRRHTLNHNFFNSLAEAQAYIKTYRQVTAIGGGHGLGRLLSSLSFLNSKLIGIVTTTDNGGSTGLLRDAHACIAWGDIRNCLSQLAKQPLATQLLDYRFKEPTELKGHNLGNLLLYTLNELSGRPLDAIKVLSGLCRVRNCILPMSEVPVDLVAETNEQLSCFGEVLVDALEKMPVKLSLSQEVAATPEVVKQILKSEVIILGPGSLLTSITPPLLVSEIKQALAQTTAKIIFIDNLMPENSPAKHLNLGQKVQWLENHLLTKKIDAAISHQLPTNGLPVFNGVTAEPNFPHRHDKESLVLTLAHALNSL